MGAVLVTSIIYYGLTKRLKISKEKRLFSRCSQNHATILKSVFLAALRIYFSFKLVYFSRGMGHELINYDKIDCSTTIWCCNKEVN